MSPTAALSCPDVLPLAEEFQDLATRLERGGTVSEAEAYRLVHHPDLLEVATLADLVARRKWEGSVFLGNPLRLPLQGLCEPGCRVCSQQGVETPLGQPVPAQGLLAAVAAHGRPEVHLVAREADLQWSLEELESLLRSLRAQDTQRWLAACTPGQIDALARKAGHSVSEVLGRLHKAGLDSLLAPDEEIYTAQGPCRTADAGLDAEQIADIQAAAHACGVATVLSLRYGPEPDGDAFVATLLKMRARQQATAGSSVIALVPQVVANSSSLQQAPGGYEDLRVTALARLVLDKVPHVRIPWMAQGLKMGQVALSFGGDDLGWIALDPHVRAYAHPASFLAVSVQALRRLTQGAGHRLTGVDGAYRSCDLTAWETPAEPLLATESAEASSSCDSACGT